RSAGSRSRGRSRRGASDGIFGSAESEVKGTPSAPPPGSGAAVEEGERQLAEGRAVRRIWQGLDGGEGTVQLCRGPSGDQVEDPGPPDAGQAQLDIGRGEVPAR